jgi:hypothetical protein
MIIITSRYPHMLILTLFALIRDIMRQTQNSGK